MRPQNKTSLGIPKTRINNPSEKNFDNVVEDILKVLAKVCFDLQPRFGLPQFHFI